jgi:ribosomal protein S8
MNLSKHLFWDIKIDALDFDKHKSYVISSVLEYGGINDWKQIRDYYGISEIATVAMSLRNLDKKALSFISLLSNTSKENYRCYITKQSMPQHCNF